MKHSLSSRLAAAFVMIALAGCASSDTPVTPTPVTPDMPITGIAVPSMAKVDLAVSKLMTDWHIPGGAVGVMKEGRLVYARGFGYADLEAHKEATPDALFRIASVTKPVTKAAILKLVEQGKLSLNAPAFALLPDITPLPGDGGSASRNDQRQPVDRAHRGLGQRDIG